MWGSIVLAFRPLNLPDISNYKDMWRYISPGKIIGFDFFKREYITGVEYGFYYLMSFSKVILGSNFRLFLLLFTIVTLHFTVWILYKIAISVGITTKDNKYNEFIVYLTIYFTYFGICYPGIAIRQALAMPLCLAAFYCFFKKNVPLSILIWILSFSVQRMSVVGLLIPAAYFIIPKIKKRKTIYVVMVIAIILVLLSTMTNIMTHLFQMMGGLYQRIFSYLDYTGYVSSVGLESGIDRKRLLLLLILIFVLLCVKDYDNTTGLINIFLAGIVLMVLTSNISGSSRIYDYLTVIYVPIFGSILYKREYNAIVKIPISILLILNSIISLRVLYLSI